jgi:phenylpropionate dioxygenase-like ring-hydroxylating dioxygenase large terminal subunit
MSDPGGKSRMLGQLMIAPTRADFIPKEHYTSVEFTQLENERLWPHVWQIACREEDLPEVGSFFTYKIAQQSIVVVRTAESRIQAFHNVCPHRGRELKRGNGRMSKFQCPFHGWQWNLEGAITHIPDRSDWQGCADMRDSDVHLQEVKVGKWGGFVFINMDPDCEPFERFIEPVPEFLDCLEFEQMRYAWHKTFVMQANWKTAMESFMESYHLPITHPQALPLVDSPNWGSAHGKHAKHTYVWERPPGAPSRLLDLPIPTDWRKPVADMYEWNCLQVGGIHRNGQTSDRSAKAVQRLLTELPASASYLEVMAKADQLCREAAQAEGAGWPTVTPEQAVNLGADWNIFPNMVLVFSMDSTLVLQAWPNGDDPNTCIFSMSAITRFGPGHQPKFEREVYSTWQENRDKIPPLLVQDLSNIEGVQRGMRSVAFRGGRTNPKQEVQISHHHQVLERYLFDF